MVYLIMKSKVTENISKKGIETFKYTMMKVF